MRYKITEDNGEIIETGRLIEAENPLRYPERMRQGFLKCFWDFLPDEDLLLDLWYCAVYHQQIYGTSVLEYFTFRFQKRTHKEKIEYITWYGRFLYMAFLNKDRDLHLLDNKFEAYNLLKPFYKRDAIKVAGWEDFDTFCDFARRYGTVFVKPVNLELAEGVHRLSIRPEDDLKTVFESLLDEASKLYSEDVTRPVEHGLILEEELRQSAQIAQFNPMEMSVLRVTTILVKGKVHFFYPVFRMMCGNGEDLMGERYSYDALIDAETGELVTDGIHSLEEVKCHPVTGMKIKGFRMPQWDELKSMLEETARMLPTLRYIGWDVAHTDRGWCIIEGNTNGEFFFQMCTDRGLKREFEDLIGFHVPFGFMLEDVEQLVDKRKHKVEQTSR